MNKMLKIIRHFFHEAVIFLIPLRLRKSIMPSCQRVSEMLEEENLSVSNSIKLKMHLFICQCCTDYKAQIETISKKARDLEFLNLTQEQKTKILNSKKDIIKNLNKKS